MISAAAARYARALADVVVDPASGKKPGEALEELRAVESMISESVILKAALITPAIPGARKKAALGKLMDEMAISKLIRNFLFVIVDHKRIPLLPEIREGFERALDDRLGFVRADVTSAAALTPLQTSSLEAELARLGGKGVRVRYAVDEYLLGGAVARVGSTVYDGSLRGQLQAMRRELIARAAGE
ncbi:MAG TPA: ATP synthase F1 subunit delta [Bryobacteraceae bacterium]|nr:ATP synthase F1 subunit delta [Bryobacteraceae bacterium]